MGAAYSRIDRTNDKYAVSRISLGQCCTFRLRNPSVVLAFLHMLLMWMVQDKSFAMLSPRYGFDCTSFRMVLLSW